MAPTSENTQSNYEDNHKTTGGPSKYREYLIFRGENNKTASPMKKDSRPARQMPTSHIYK
jgi:hypothetical protein